MRVFHACINTKIPNDTKSQPGRSYRAQDNTRPVAERAIAVAFSLRLPPKQNPFCDVQSLSRVARYQQTAYPVPVSKWHARQEAWQANDDMPTDCTARIKTALGRTVTASQQQPAKPQPTQPLHHQSNAFNCTPCRDNRWRCGWTHPARTTRKPHDSRYVSRYVSRYYLFNATTRNGQSTTGPLPSTPVMTQLSNFNNPLPLSWPATPRPPQT